MRAWHDSWFSELISNHGRAGWRAGGPAAGWGGHQMSGAIFQRLEAKQNSHISLGSGEFYPVLAAAQQ